LTKLEIETLLPLLPVIGPLLYFSRSEDENNQGNRALRKYLEIVGSAIERAYAQGTHALVVGLHESFSDVSAADPELDHFGTFCAANLFDGFHTAATAITNTAYQLARNPLAQARVHEDDTLIPVAVKEACASPIH